MPELWGRIHADNSKEWPPPTRQVQAKEELGNRAWGEATLWAGLRSLRFFYGASILVGDKYILGFDSASDFCTKF